MMQRNYEDASSIFFQTERRDDVGSFIWGLTNPWTYLKQLSSLYPANHWMTSIYPHCSRSIERRTKDFCQLLIKEWLSDIVVSVSGRYNLISSSPANSLVDSLSLRWNWTKMFVCIWTKANHSTDDLLSIPFVIRDRGILAGDSVSTDRGFPLGKQMWPFSLCRRWKLSEDRSTFSTRFPSREHSSKWNRSTCWISSVGPKSSGWWKLLWQMKQQLERFFLSEKNLFCNEYVPSI